MKKILILESTVQEKPAGFDHIFSFHANPADSFTHDYLKEEDAIQIYDQQFLAFTSYLNQWKGNDAFVYRGVHLLECFKKSLFEFTYYVRHRYETLKRVIDRHGSPDIYLSGEDEFFNFPSLSNILKDTALAGHPKIHFLPDKASAPAAKALKPGHHWRDFWPGNFAFGKLNRSKVVIYSDFEKSKNVLRLLAPQDCVLFSSSASPRTALRAWRDGHAYYQVTNPDSSRAEGVSEAKAKPYLDRAKECQLFSNFSWGDVNGHRLMRQELTRLFGGSLPSLMDGIDQMHRFFQRAPSLRSALLDEDVNPLKNAFCQIARQYRVSSFVEIHGCIARPIGVLPLAADKVFVWGNAQKHKLAAWGCSEDRIIISGCSRYGYYQRLNEKKIRTEVSKRLGLDSKKKILLIAMPTTTINRGRFIFEAKVIDYISRTLRAIDEFLAGNPSLQVILKVHPGDENRLLFLRWAKQRRSRSRVVVMEKFDPLVLAKASDFLLTYMSTYAIEALALNKPVIYLFADEDYGLLSEMKKFNAFYYPKDLSQLKQILSGLMESHEKKLVDWQEAKKEYLNDPGECPARVIASYLEHSPSKREAIRPTVDSKKLTYV